MILRRPERSEADQIAALRHDTWHASFGLTGPRDLCAFRTLDFYRARVAASLPRFWLAGPSDRPIGLSLADGPYLAALFVAVGEQGRGIGTALLQNAEAEMAANGFSLASLDTAIDNVQAIGFYERHRWNKSVIKKHQLETVSGAIFLDGLEMTKAL